LYDARLLTKLTKERVAFKSLPTQCCRREKFQEK